MQVFIFVKKVLKNIKKYYIIKKSRNFPWQNCLSGGIGRRTGLKILRESNHVPVQVRPEAPLMEKYPSLAEGTGLENQEVG